MPVLLHIRKKIIRSKMINRKKTIFLGLVLTIALFLMGGCSSCPKPEPSAPPVAAEELHSSLTIDPIADISPSPKATPTTTTTSVSTEQDKALFKDLADDYKDVEDQTLADPLYYWNWCWFEFNDKFYFVLIKPLSTGWRYLIYPEFARKGVYYFIENLGFPGRFLNCGFQGRFKHSGAEFVRFLTNTTIGVAGFWDASGTLFGMKQHEADFDQTLGKWHAGQGIYLVWPLMGPSSIRGTFGAVGDSGLNPIYTSSGATVIRTMNNTSLGLNPYESLLKMALDPYTTVRNAYVQNRKQRVEGE
ncbi:TPA: hypothetical protein DDW35_03545 [Candidatus Sumerlaeota bacterium]|nr:hypothetical protein [Candidatus Sumerlaeota bacterium]